MSDLPVRVNENFAEEKNGCLIDCAEEEEEEERMALGNSISFVTRSRPTVFFPSLAHDMFSLSLIFLFRISFSFHAY